MINTYPIELSSNEFEYLEYLLKKGEQQLKMEASYDAGAFRSKLCLKYEEARALVEDDDYGIDVRQLCFLA